MRVRVEEYEAAPAFPRLPFEVRSSPAKVWAGTVTRTGESDSGAAASSAPLLRCRQRRARATPRMAAGTRTRSAKRAGPAEAAAGAFGVAAASAVAGDDAAGLAPGESEAAGGVLVESAGDLLGGGGVTELHVPAAPVAAPLGVCEAAAGALGEAVGVGELAGVCGDDGVSLGVAPAGDACGVAAVGEGEASGEAEDVAVAEPVAEAVAPAGEGDAEGSAVGEGAAGDAAGDAASVGDGNACPSPVTRRKALPPLSARKRSPPKNTLPTGARNLAAVPAPFAEPDDPLPAIVVTASVVGSRTRSALLDESLIISPVGPMVIARGLKNVAAVPTPSVNPLNSWPASVDTSPAGLMSRNR